MAKKLYRSRKDRIVAGVCGGLAEYFGLDPTLVRIIMAALSLGGGFGLVFYILAWLFIPEAPEG
ncbi:MAG TPA: PspC domain-containing protein [Chloroflexi bacterium]|nr:MAG: PspC domain-containing protein [Thermoplasmata archaeon]HDN80110.1 PspC domain-containing protein [Chloroflexota bacterium]